MAMNPMRMVLVGPMGSGKSTVGRRLAQALGWPFLDSDHEIERRTGVDIPYIFEKEGEAGFRRREREVVLDLLQDAPLVLASGGGAILDPMTRDAMRRAGVVVYLAASVDQQLRRTRKDSHRPLLQVADPRARLEALYAVRDPLYREVAHLRVDTDHQRPAEVADEILRHVAVR